MALLLALMMVKISDNFAVITLLLKIVLSLVHFVPVGHVYQHEFGLY